MYDLKNPNFIEMEAHALEEYTLRQHGFRRHDPKSIVEKNAKEVNLTWPYAHNDLKEERAMVKEKCFREVQHKRLQEDERDHHYKSHKKKLRK
jgi:hypothetical protein